MLKKEPERRCYYCGCLVPATSKTCMYCNHDLDEEYRKMIKRKGLDIKE